MILNNPQLAGGLEAVHCYDSLINRTFTSFSRTWCEICGCSCLFVHVCVGFWGYHLNDRLHVPPETPRCLAYCRAWHILKNQGEFANMHCANSMHRNQSTPWRIFLERAAVQHSGYKMWSLCDALSFFVWTTEYQGSYATMTPFRNAPICSSLCPRSARLMTVEIIVSGVTRHQPSLTNAVHAIHLMISINDSSTSGHNTSRFFHAR